jgi:YggT family protein
MDVPQILASFLNLYVMVLLAYVVMSWFVGGSSGTLRDVYRALGTVCEPYLSLFRRVVPPIVIGSGGMDLSPIIALFVLQIVASLIQRLG